MNNNENENENINKLKNINSWTQVSKRIGTAPIRKALKDQDKYFNFDDNLVVKRENPNGSYYYEVFRVSNRFNQILIELGSTFDGIFYYLSKVELNKFIQILPLLEEEEAFTNNKGYVKAEELVKYVFINANDLDKMKRFYKENDVFLHEQDTILYNYDLMRDLIDRISFSIPLDVEGVLDISPRTGMSLIRKANPNLKFGHGGHNPFFNCRIVNNKDKIIQILNNEVLKGAYKL